MNIHIYRVDTSFEVPSRVYIYTYNTYTYMYIESMYTYIKSLYVYI